MSILAKERDLAVRAAREAGDIVRHWYARPITVTEKGPDHPLTRADLEANACIRGHIEKAFPEDGPVVVFITAFSQYAAQAFDVRATDYVLKPFSDRRLSEAIARAKRRVQERRLGGLAAQMATLAAEMHPDEHARPNGDATPYLERLSFRAGDRSIVLKIAEVIWIEAEDYYVLIHSKRGRHMVRATLSSLEQRLDPRVFLRVHRAAVVNLQEVQEIRDDGGLSLVLSDGSHVAVSRSKRERVDSVLRPRFRA